MMKAAAPAVNSGLLGRKETPGSQARLTVFVSGEDFNRNTIKVFKNLVMGVLLRGASLFCSKSESNANHSAVGDSNDLFEWLLQTGSCRSHL